MAEASRRQRILLVDDSPFFLARLKDMVAAMGYEILERTRAREAQDLVAKEHGAIDLLVMDLKMPEMDGFEFLRWLRSQPWGPQVGVLVLTGAYELDEIVQPLRKLGVLGLMDKGSHPHHILARINSVLHPQAGRSRHNDRVACNLPVTYTRGGARSQAVMTHIGPGGCFLATEEGVPVESSVEVSVQFPEVTGAYRFPGRVVWVLGGEGWTKAPAAVKGIGVQWKEISQDAADHLKTFIDERKEEEKLYDLILP